MKNVARFALEVKFPELADAIAAICAATSNEEVALEMLLGIYKKPALPPVVTRSLAMYHLTSFNPLESNHSAVKFLKIEVITRYFPSEKEAISNGTYWHGGRTTPSDSHTFAHTFEARLNDTCSVSDWQSYKVVEEDL